MMPSLLLKPRRRPQLVLGFVAGDAQLFGFLVDGFAAAAEFVDHLLRHAGNLKTLAFADDAIAQLFQIRRQPVVIHGFVVAGVVLDRSIWTALILPSLIVRCVHEQQMIVNSYRASDRLHLAASCDA